MAKEPPASATPAIHRRRGQRQRRPRGLLHFILEACFLIFSIMVYALYLDSTVELPSEQDIRELQEAQSATPPGLSSMKVVKNNQNALLWIVIRSTEARLGNNMFQFASSFGAVENYKRNPVKLCIHPEFDLPYLNQTVVGPFAPYCPEHIVNHERLQEVGEMAYATYNEIKFPPCDASDYCVFALKGYFQSYRYFQDCCAKEIRERFEFLPSIQQTASQVLETLAASKPIVIGMHVRRGDMSAAKHRGRFYLREPPVSYYQSAMHHFYEMYQSIQFVVASDDPEWCEENLKPLDNSMVILRNHSAAVDLAILSSCHHVIMSRGSYGWWAGWLSGSKAVYYKDAFVLEHPENEGRVVLSDHYPPNWAGLGSMDDAVQQ